jgi:hypothetical protein
VSDERDWAAIEADYRAGIKSLRAIADEHKPLTEGAIRKRAKKEGWERDLEAQIREKADALVRKEAVRTEVRKATCVPEKKIIEANADLQFGIRIAHRERIKGLSATAGKMKKRLDGQKRGELGKQVGVLKSLVEIEKTLVGLERQAFGIADNAEGDTPAKPADELSTLEAARKVAFVLAQGSRLKKKAGA